MYTDHDRKLLSLPARFGGFGIQIKTKRERRYRNTWTELQNRMVMKNAWIPSHRKREYQIN